MLEVSTQKKIRILKKVRKTAEKIYMKRIEKTEQKTAEKHVEKALEEI